MSREKNDDPQVHLLAAQHCERTRKICAKPPNDFDENDVQILNSSIKFFSHFIKYLPECSKDVLDVCCCYTGKVIKLDFVGINRIIVVCTTMMIRRKEESVIRDTCNTLMKILVLIPEDALKRIVNRYSRTLGFIFQKIYLVMTYYTQLRILDIFVFITKDLIQLREETIAKHQLMKNANSDILKKVIQRINDVDSNDLINTSKRVLKIFNNFLFPKTNILSFDGIIKKINNQVMKPSSKNLMISFNGRNLTISFFIPISILSEAGLKKNSKSQVDNENDLIFIEFDCKSFNLEDEIDNGEPFMLSNVTINHINTDDLTKCSFEIDDIKTISFKLRDEPYVSEKFKKIFYQRFKNNQAMIEDNPSIIDKESIMTFQTSASMNDEITRYKESKEDKPVETQGIVQNVKVDAIVHDEPKKKSSGKAEITIDNKKINSRIVKKEQPPQKASKVPNRKSAIKMGIIESPNESLTKSRPKRQNAKKVDYKKLEDIYDEDNMPEPENVKMSYSEFKATQNKKSNENEFESVAGNSNANYYLSPPRQPITRTTQRQNKSAFKSTKILQKPKPKHYSTDESEKEHEEIENNRSIANEKSKVNSAKQAKGKKVSKKPAKTSINIEKRTKTEKPKKRKATIESNEPDAKLAKIEIEKNKPMEKSKQLPNPKINDNGFHQFISEMNRSIDRENKKVPAKNKLTNPKPRKMTKDNVFEICMMEDEENQKKSLIEEWLEKTSDSMEFGVSDQIDSSMSAILGNNLQNGEAFEMLCNELDNSPDPRNSQNDSEESYEGLQNDEHQHYSSSSQESLDLDLKNTTRVKVQEDAVGTFEDNERQLMSQHFPMKNGTSVSFVVDPCKIFKDRSTEFAAKLNARRTKLIEIEAEILSKHDKTISIYGKKYYDQIQRTKHHLANVTQLYDRYERAKSKLMDEVIEQEKLANVLKREVTKRREVSEFHKQIKKKELLNLKKEAVQKNEELMNDVWREYVDGFYNSFNSSLKNVYEI